MLHKFYSLRKHKKILNRSLHALGIGVGGDVGVSGEEVALKLLQTSSYFSAQDSLIIFDVGANVGKYTTLCLQHLRGGGG